MAFDLTLELRMSVNTREEARLIMEACDSGLAEMAIKERVLFNYAIPAAPQSNPKRQTATKSDNSQPVAELKRVNTHKHESKVVAEEAVSVERNRGILGRGRMERSGG